MINRIKRLKFEEERLHKDIDKIQNKTTNLQKNRKKHFEVLNEFTITQEIEALRKHKENVSKKNAENQKKFLEDRNHRKAQRSLTLKQRKNTNESNAKDIKCQEKQWKSSIHLERNATIEKNRRQKEKIQYQKSMSKLLNDFNKKKSKDNQRQMLEDKLKFETQMKENNDQMVKFYFGSQIKKMEDYENELIEKLESTLQNQTGMIKDFENFYCTHSPRRFKEEKEKTNKRSKSLVITSKQIIGNMQLNKYSIV